MLPKSSRQYGSAVLPSSRALPPVACFVAGALFRSFCLLATCHALSRMLSACSGEYMVNGKCETGKLGVWMKQLATRSGPASGPERTVRGMAAAADAASVTFDPSAVTAFCIRWQVWAARAQECVKMFSFARV